MSRNDAGLQYGRVLHFLPGRMRIEMPGLQGAKNLSRQLERRLNTVKGVTAARANPLTGRLLIVYDNRLHSKASVAALTGGCWRETLQAASGSAEKRPEATAPEATVTGTAVMPSPRLPAGGRRTDDGWYRHRRLKAYLTAGLTGLIAWKRFVLGPSRLALSPGLFYASALLTVVSGYPLLSRCLRELTAGGPVIADPALKSAGLATAVLRESVPPLTVNLMEQAALLQEADVRKEYERQALSGVAPAAALKKTLSRRATGAGSWESTDNEPGGPGNTYLGLAVLNGITTSDWQRSLAMLMAACPGQAAMLRDMTFIAGAREASAAGIYLDRPETLQKLATVDTVLFNETGALFTPSRVGDIIPLDGADPDGVLFTAAVLTTEANHPLAGVLMPEDRDGLKPYRAGIIMRQQNGVRGWVNGIPATVGNAAFTGPAARDVRARLLVRQLVHLRQTPLYVTRNGRLTGIIGIVSTMRENARELIHLLRIQGVTMTGIISSEEPGVLQPLAERLGVWEFSAAGLSTAEKVRLINNLQHQKRVVAVICTGARGAACLSAADVGIKLNRAGFNGRAEVLIPEISPGKLKLLFQLSRQYSFKAEQKQSLYRGATGLGLFLAACRRLNAPAAALYNSAATLLLGLSALSPARRRSHSNRPDRNAKAKSDARPAVDRGTENSPPVPAGHGKMLKTGNENGTNLPGKLSCNNGWPALSVNETFLKLGSDPHRGLTGEEAQKRLSLCGPNRLAESRPPGIWRRVYNQLNNFMVQALLGSTVICFFLGETGDALAILSIVAMNALLGLLQEQKAENALAALKKMTAPTARVLRNSRRLAVPAAGLVPGDVIFLEQGDIVPADVRLCTAHCLEVEESSLTGESCPVGKKTAALKNHDLVHECLNMAFMGTTVTRGRGTGIVVATGMNTEMGNIAGLLIEKNNGGTPLQQKLEVIGKTVLKACLAVSGVVVVAGILRGHPPFSMFLTGVSLAVAAIPEGLPATVTVALAAGVWRLAREHAVVRNLPGVETLGCASVICTDKTGTLTKNELTVQYIYCPQNLWQVSGAGYAPEGEIWEAGRPDAPQTEEALKNILIAGILCSDARVVRERKPDTRWKVLGDPLEGALLVAGMKAGLLPEVLRRTFPRLSEIPFDSEQGYMAVCCAGEGGNTTLYYKGAPEKILSMCRWLPADGRTLLITEEKRREIMAMNEHLSSLSLRVLAMAARPGGKRSAPDLPAQEKDLVFLGLVGMRDPLRLEVRDAVDRCRRAGIRVVMITGDHRNTARTIGEELGILELNRTDRVITGPEIERMSESELRTVVQNASVFARVLPRHKMRLVKAFKEPGGVVAMIGDGANDAPAVKSADIGVAMGLSGTDVTRKASTIVITDDNFATLVTAIEQGRGIYDNIRKSVRYLLATNAGEVVLMFLTVVSGLPLALLPIQLLFLNLLGDGFPAIALGLDNPAPNVMEQKPRSPRDKFFDREYTHKIVSRGIAIGVSGMAGYLWGLGRGNLPLARTVTLATLTLSQLLHALDCRWDYHVNGERARNKYLTGAVSLSAALLAGAVYLPSLRTIFKTRPLGPADLSAVGLGVGLSTLLDRALTGLLNSIQPGGDKAAGGDRNTVYGILPEKKMLDGTGTGKIPALRGNLSV
ncbi:HAD-IC family P-type ATPase [Desulfotomaculum copahuensis]|uniref:Cation-transporting P-type ATPase N-terminal domain-containing protein n=1 Tax=Desulfotomaculum copahuensis TaxID=1838280 RepID=A0A1B7LHL9_9FIRM|nr:HAD-IC family P-type ATPase [Desulfotomaculum copahuensis]OAT85791.1 hypothetical protein A6M21_04675 [Desulfotomaculum copahuensis]